MLDLAEQTLEDNLWLLPAATQRALRDVDGQPDVSVQRTDSGIKASIRTPEGRWVPVPNQPEGMPGLERMIASGTTPPLIIVVGLGLGHLLDLLERRRVATRVIAIEPVRALTRAMLARRDWDEWLRSGRLTLLVGPDYPDLDGIPQPACGVRLPPVILTPLLQREFPEQAAGATKLLRHIVATLSSQHCKAS